MKVYQIIYTSVQHCLSDTELGLTNQSGLRVYSCSQGLTRENLDEVVRVCGYRLPKDNTVEYSKTVGDPQIPEMFPKTFRTLRLADGKLAVIQSVYSGVDYLGHEGNFFAHALIFEDFDTAFLPELYYGSSLFKKCLNEDELKREIVPYLPCIEALPDVSDFEKDVCNFITGHKKELSYIINNAIGVITSQGTVKNICISTSDEKETAMYLIALKYLIPRDIKNNMGISTYNVYLPSDKQEKIIFHGTIKGKNNISQQAIDTRDSCIYIDIDKLDMSAYAVSPIIDKWEPKELRNEYERLDLKSAPGLMDWENTFENITSPGMGAKLIRLKESGSDSAFAYRAMQLYPKLREEEYKDIRFEVLKVMYDNIDLFPDEVTSLTDMHMSDVIAKMNAGETFDLSTAFSSVKNEKQQIAEMKRHIPAIMDAIGSKNCGMDDKTKYIILGLFARIKHKYGDTNWRDFFGGNRIYLTAFVETAASVIITGYGVKPFSPPSNWDKNDMAELIAFFEASTEDRLLRKYCLKYIYQNKDIDWAVYGITMTKHTKTQGEQAEDIQKIRKILKKVGYEPYQRNKYTDVQQDVKADMQDNLSPLLLCRLLSAYYVWARSYGNQAKAKDAAQLVRSLLLEMKKTQKTCYDFIIPKLALEIIETPGHYHELMINTETMCPSFWNWFLIGYTRCKRDDEKMLTYTRIYHASKTKMQRLPIRKKLRKVFANVE